jgi:transcriptional regulator with XRE-family HTH domain
MTKKFQNLSPFAEWLIQLTGEHNISLAALAHRAGLSPGTLRYLAIEPKRKPTLETCLRLSAFAGRPMDDLVLLAGLVTPDPIGDTYHPDKLKLTQIFDDLPLEGRAALLKVAIALDEVCGLEENRERHDSKPEVH